VTARERLAGHLFSSGLLAVGAAAGIAWTGLQGWTEPGHVIGGLVGLAIALGGLYAVHPGGFRWELYRAWGGWLCVCGHLNRTGPACHRCGAPRPC
jgi:hypothetical protein